VGRLPVSRRAQIIQWLKDNPGMHSAKEVGEGIDFAPTNAGRYMLEMANRGVIDRYIVSRPGSNRFFVRYAIGEEGARLPVRENDEAMLPSAIAQAKIDAAFDMAPNAKVRMKPRQVQHTEENQ
jgi:hypothetical protein